jgi:hypothetical protein
MPGSLLSTRFFSALLDVRIGPGDKDVVGHAIPGVVNADEEQEQRGGPTPNSASRV